MSLDNPVNRGLDIINGALRSCPLAGVIVSLTKAAPVESIRRVAKLLEYLENRMLRLVLYANAQIIHRLSGPGAAVQQK